MLKIPSLTGAYAYEQNLALDGERWIVRLAWSDRAKSWYLSVRPESDEVWVISGERLTPEYPIGLSASVRGGPRGVFVLLAGSYADAQGVPIGVQTLGNEWGLYYLTGDEVKALRERSAKPYRLKVEKQGGP